MARYSTRIDVVDRDFMVEFAADLSEESRKEQLIDFAKEERNKAIAQNKAALGQAPDYETRIDGGPGRLESARSTSTIEFEFQLVNEMFEWIADMLLLNSPVGSPADKRPNHPELYARSHLLFIDKVLVDADGPVPMPHEEAVFVNIQPYARKIERKLSSQAPEGVYQVVAHLAARRFGNYAKIRFGFRTPYNFGAIHEWADTTKMASPYRRGEKRDEWLRRQPAIVITF